MPLTAYLYSQQITAPLLNDNVWGHIKKSLRENPNFLHFKCCQSPVYARKSKRGLKHFVHKNTDGCRYVHESEEHLLLKMEVFEACIDAGWSAEVEYAAEDFRADVLAQKDGQKIAFEIQLSRQDFRTTIERQKTFQKSGVRGAWLFKYMPKGFRPSRFLPAFELTKNNVERIAYNCVLPGKKMQLKQFVKLLLAGGIKFRKQLTFSKQQKAKIYIFEEICWRCGFRYDAVGAWTVLQSRCGVEIVNGGFEIDNLGYEAKKALDSFRDSRPNIAVFRKSLSRTAGSSYWANNCPACKAILGQRFLADKVLALMADEETPNRAITYEIDNVDKFKPIDCSHWCLEGPERFCDD